SRSAERPARPHGWSGRSCRPAEPASARLRPLTRLLVAARAADTGFGAPPADARAGLRGLGLMTTSALRAPPGERRQAGDGERPENPRRLLAAGASAACTATGIGLAVVTILVVIGWIAAPHIGLGLIGVVRTAAVLWLVGHHVAVHVSGAGQIGMLPLGLVALPGALLWRAGRAVGRGHRVRGVREAAAVGLAVGCPCASPPGGPPIAPESSP